LLIHSRAVKNTIKIKPIDLIERSKSIGEEKMLPRMNADNADKNENYPTVKSLSRQSKSYPCKSAFIRG